MSDTDWPPAAGFQSYAPPTRPPAVALAELATLVVELTKRVERLEREANENGWAHK